MIKKIGNEEIETIIINTTNKRWYLSYNDGKLIIKAPKKYSPKDIDKIIDLHEQRLLKMIETQKTRYIQSFNEAISILFYGKEFKLLYASKNEIGINALYVKKDNPKDGYLTLSKNYGKNYYQNRINEYIKKFNLPVTVKEINIRLMKTRYGVCNTKLKKITFNSQLAYFPVPLIDYIIIHELCHLIIPNHSKLFYAKIKEILPNYKNLEKELGRIKL